MAQSCGKEIIAFVSIKVVACYRQDLGLNGRTGCSCRRVMVTILYIQPIITGSVSASPSSVMKHLSVWELDMEPYIVPTESVFAFNVTRPISTISLNCIKRLFFANEMDFTLPGFEV